MKKFFRFFLSLPIIFYRKVLSPLKPPCCRYQPTCSKYALEAIEKFGIKGILLAVWRILRCNPFGGMGYDPVPEKFTFKRKKLNYNTQEKDIE